MKKKKLKRVSVLALSLVMALSLTSLPVYAGEMQSGAVDLTVNSSTVAFAGYEWWVIGKEGDGVYPQTGHITLLSANNYFGSTAFRTGDDESFNNSTQYNSGSYYANNPSGDTWTTPNEYAGSTLQQYMESIPNNYNFPDKEVALITARDLASGADSNNNWSYGKDVNTYMDGIAGQSILNQKLWALSSDEWSTIDDDNVRSYDSLWWLRSPMSSEGNSAQVGLDAGSDTVNFNVSYKYDAARPAFSLNLESVIFTSAASDNGKSLATVESGFTSMGTIDENSTVKFTMQDSSQTLTVSATQEQSVQSGDTLKFSYSNATTGTNQYVSCVLTDSEGNVAYYAKLVNSSNAASGSLSIPLTGVEAGTYTLKIFSEEANGDLYTDFCSEPVTATLAVDENGVGTVSNFSGDVSSTGTTDSDSSISTTGTTSTGSTTGTADTDSTPQTGDNSTFALWIAIMLMTGAGLTSSLVFLRKHR